MNKNSILILLVIIETLLFSCTEEPVGQQPIDNIPPGPVSSVKVKNMPGGAILTYQLPEDEDLLYVKAIYSRRDNILCEAKASVYTDTLKVEGFGDTIPREVKLIAVDRSRNESPEVAVKIHPLEAPVVTIGKTLELVADFGGVHAYWDNPIRAEISVVVLKDSNNEYVPIETFYSTKIKGDGAVRGMDTIPAKFGVYVQDRWENRSETKYYSLTPIYETIFDRFKLKAVYVPGDETEYYPGWEPAKMFDGISGPDNGYSTLGTGTWPQSVTIDLGKLCRVSRIRLYQRSGPYTFGEGNIRKFELWGSAEPDFHATPEKSWDSFIKLADCESIKPSGLPRGQNTNEDIEVAVNGEDFSLPPTAPKIRYLRIRVTENWTGVKGNFQISELEIYGDNR